MKIKGDVPEPHCTCEGAYLFCGLRARKNVKDGQGTPRPTRLSMDKETCKFCGHYALWRVAGTVDRPSQDPAPRFDQDEYSIMEQ